MINLLPLSSPDWCHLCGERKDRFVAFNIPFDAKNGMEEPSRYVMLCKDCIQVMSDEVK